MANLVIGPDSSYAPSRELTIPADRERFHEIRANAGLILIGGKTAREEPYGTVGQPLLIITHQPLSSFAAILHENENIKFFVNEDQLPFIEIATRESEKLWRRYQGGKYLLVEGGPALISDLVTANLLDTLFLTRSPRVASGAKMGEDELEKILTPATLVDQYLVNVENSSSGATFEEYEYWRGEGV